MSSWKVNNMDYKKQNEKAWDSLAKQNDTWTIPISTEEVDKARGGDFKIVLTPTKAIPRDWFPKEIKGIKILCLASGGGQQGPILAALGAEVTVFDNSQEQLGKDIFVAKRDNLTIKTVKGDMQDLSCFADETFDLIVHPWSNCFIDSVIPVWKESFRVLKKGGSLLSGFGNPVSYIFDLKEYNSGNLMVRHSIPYSDLTSLSKEEFKEQVSDKNEPVTFGHTLQDQIGGQINVGFSITGFYEDNFGGDDILDKYISAGIATKATK